MIKRDYTYAFHIDNLPSVRPYEPLIQSTQMRESLKREPMQTHGVEVGQKVGNKKYLMNHFHFVIKYNYFEPEMAEMSPEKMTYSIVGFEVHPESKKHDMNRLDDKCLNRGEKFILNSEDTPSFTYDVSWELDTQTSWELRWDAYYFTGTDEIHWASILIAFAEVLCIAGLIAQYLSKALKRDIATYEKEKEKKKQKILKIYEKKGIPKPSEVELQKLTSDNKNKVDD